MIGEILLIVLSFALIFSGAAGVILPFLPGAPIAWLGLLLFAYATDFVSITITTVLIFFGFTAFTIVLDIVTPLVGAKKYQASRYGVIGSFLGLLGGILLFGPLGIVLGPFLGALSGELLYGKETKEALRSAKGTIIGFLAGSIIKLTLIMVMLGFMIVALF
jgi:uncharacterized protein YqgC (DUF456 family)